MSREEIVEGNKLIAEYMGCRVYLNDALMKVCADDNDHDGICYHCEWHPEYTGSSKIMAWGYEPNENWCQLMPVVEKILSITDEYTISFSGNNIFEVGLGTPKEEIWEYIVEFIKWENKNKP